MRLAWKAACHHTDWWNGVKSTKDTKAWVGSETYDALKKHLESAPPIE